jgi:hypothetical protein
MTSADRLYSHPQSSLRQMVLWRIISTMPAADNFSVAGAARAAREIGYTKVADLIVDERLSPERIVRLFSASASKTAKGDAAFVVLVGSIARYCAGSQGWSPEPETSLALELGGRSDFARATDEAARFVDHWPEIEAMAEARAAA